MTPMDKISTLLFVYNDFSDSPNEIIDLKELIKLEREILGEKEKICLSPPDRLIENILMNVE